MPKLFSSSVRKFLKQVNKPESELNKFICENWASLFSNLILISSEFSLKGNVRSIGTSGRIDILAYNPKSKRFVIFELKKEYDKNITEQVSDYREYIEDNFADVYLKTTQQYNVELPKFQEMDLKQIEIVLIAKKFSITQIERVKKIKKTTLH